MSKETAARMAGEWWSKRLRQGDKECFAQEVAQRILKAFKESDLVVLSCDDDPQGILVEAVRAIGIECDGKYYSLQAILPMKCSMCVTAELLEAKEGYLNSADPIPVPQSYFYEGKTSMSVEVQFRILFTDNNVRKISQFMHEAILRRNLPPWIWRMGQNSTGFSSSGSASPYLHFSLVIEEAHYSTPVEVILDFFTGWLKEQGIYGPVNVSKVTIDWRDPYER